MQPLIGHGEMGVRSTVGVDQNLVISALAPLRLELQELDAFVAALTRHSQPAIRLRPEINPAILPFASEPVPWHRQGFFIPKDARPGGTLAFASGQFYVQDASSLLALAVLSPRPGEWICDLCAAPGGKSTAILESLGDSGWLLANEAVQSRRAVLEFNLARHGSSRYLVSALDPDELARRAPSQFDAVLVDAPCSGQSLIGKGKQRFSSFAAHAIEHCAARQTRILDAAAQLVRPGGRMVYSTCTFAYAENEGQIASFLERSPEWQIERPIAELVAAVQGGPQDLGLRLWPQRHGCGGAFAACLRRSANADIELGQPRRRDREFGLQAAPLPAEFHEWGELRDAAIYHSGLQCFAWPTDVPCELIEHARAGPEVAFKKVSTWFPSYALAMRRDPRWMPRQTVKLDDPLARQFMRGEVLRGELIGWGVATWQGHALGWLKGDGKQMKNHLPKAGRIT